MMNKENDDEQHVDFSRSTVRRLTRILEDENGTFSPPERRVIRLAFRNPETEGYIRWGYSSEDGMMLMNDDGDVYVRVDETTMLGTLYEQLYVYGSANPKPPLEQHVRYDEVSTALRGILSAGFAENVIGRALRWLMSGRFR